MIQDLPLPPGSSGLPLIGETLSFVFDKNFADKRIKKYGKIFRTNILGQPTVVMSGTDANEFILSSHFMEPVPTLHPRSGLKVKGNVNFFCRIFCFYLLRSKTVGSISSILQPTKKTGFLEVFSGLMNSWYS